MVIWGDSDRIVTTAYGAAYAAAIRRARFEIVRDAGHLPQIEQPVATLALIDDYLRDRNDQVESSLAHELATNETP